MPFLDDATDRLLLRRVGGGYLFIHRLLLEYFARLEVPGTTAAANAVPIEEIDETGRQGGSGSCLSAEVERDVLRKRLRTYSSPPLRTKPTHPCLLGC